MRERMARLQAVCLQLEEQQQQQAGSPRGGAAGSQPQQQTELLDKLSATLCALGPSNGADSAIGVRDAAGRLPPALAPAKVRRRRCTPSGDVQMADDECTDAFWHPRVI